MRSDELARALDLANVPMARRHALGYTDQEACFNLLEICETLSQLLTEVEPEVVAAYSLIESTNATSSSKSYHCSTKNVSSSVPSARLNELNSYPVLAAW